MCGIVGILSFRERGSIDDRVVGRMRDTMAHRGPDGCDTWISDDRKVGFGHRRLSIIDVGPAASQPMPNEDGRVVITFNGEIYNHASLRPLLVAAGHRFRTDHSDTEVLVHGYEEWGLEGLLNRIEGDYAFGIWDGRKRSLLLARDRIGVKPLYFAFVNGYFLFASEMKGIVATIEGEVPLSETFGYSTDLRSLTQGQGTFTMEFAKYRRVPPSIQTEVIAERKAMLVGAK